MSKSQFRYSGERIGSNELWQWTMKRGMARAGWVLRALSDTLHWRTPSPNSGDTGPNAYVRICPYHFGFIQHATIGHILTCTTRPYNGACATSIRLRDQLTMDVTTRVIARIDSACMNDTYRKKHMEKWLKKANGKSVNWNVRHLLHEWGIARSTDDDSKRSDSSHQDWSRQARLESMLFGGFRKQEVVKCMNGSGASKDEIESLVVDLRRLLLEWAHAMWENVCADDLICPISRALP
jgi:hypothetical protein